MKTRNKVLSAYLAAILFIITFLFLSIYGVFDPTIEVGQHWRQEYNVDNPFKEVRTYDYFVIDVKDGYVLFIQHINSDIDTMSEETKYFFWGKDLISK